MANNETPCEEHEKLVIDPSMRQILIPKSERVFGTYRETGVEKKYFFCPKIIGNNVDLSQCYIFIDYISSSGTYGKALCNDVEITEDNTCITFSWELTPNVFDDNKDATIYFSVHAEKMVDGKKTVTFSTEPAEGIAYANINAQEIIEKEYADIILQLLMKMDRLEDACSGEKLKAAIEQYMVEHPIDATKLTTDETLYVKSGGELAVNTAKEVVTGSSLPVTSEAVYVQIGNINALLETI